MLILTQSAYSKHTIKFDALPHMALSSVKFQFNFGDWLIDVTVSLEVCKLAMGWGEHTHEIVCVCVY